MEAERSATLDIKFIKESLDRVVHLNDVESQDDPEDNPYKSKYAAREIMQEMRTQLKKYLDLALADIDNTESHSLAETDGEVSESIGTEEGAAAAPCSSNIDVNQVQLSFEDLYVSHQQKVELFLRFLEGKLGTNFIECDETSSGEEHISQALYKIEKSFKSAEPASAYVVQFLLNQLGILYAARRQNERAETQLHKAESVYNDYKKQYTTAPLSPTDLLVGFPGRLKIYETNSVKYGRSDYLYV